MTSDERDARTAKRRLLRALLSGLPKRGEAAASLDELGREGYELTWVFMDQKLDSEKDGHVLIFKRSVVRQSSVAPVSGRRMPAWASVSE